MTNDRKQTTTGSAPGSQSPGQGAQRNDQHAQGSSGQRQPGQSEQHNRKQDQQSGGNRAGQQNQEAGRRDQQRSGQDQRVDGNVGGEEVTGTVDE